MKKVLSILLCAAILLSLSAVCAYAETDDSPLSADIRVTVADKDGKTVVAAEPITVTDTDSDGALTVSDALYTAHEQFYDGGAAAGYATGNTQYGLSLVKLWGTANGGSYGYYVNNNSAWSLTDPVKDGNYVAAFIYTDPVGWSDHYSYFDQLSVDTYAGRQVSLTYFESSYDADWNPVALPVKGAKIIVNGEETAIVTNNDGVVKLSFNTPGTYTVSAAAEGKTLVAPICIVTIKPAATLIGDADRSGKVEILDATRIQRWLAALVTDDEIDMANADADRSGAVDILDATAIQRYLAGIIPEL